MIKNYFKIAWRNLTQNKVYSAINITGLAIGLAVCMLIMLYVGHESHYDRFHRDAENIFWMQGKIKMGSDSVFVGSMSYASGPLVKQEEPAVESFLRYKQQSANTVISNPAVPDRKFAEEKFLFADSNFFSFFSFPLFAGNSENVLNDPFTIVLSHNTARKYFGDENPVGKIIRYNNEYDFRVTGVAAPIPSNSSVGFDFIASLSSMKGIKEEKKHTESQLVENGNFRTTFRLKNARDKSKLETRMLQLFLRSTGEKEENNFSFMATPLIATHLRANYGDNSGIKYLEIFPMIAGLVLLLAMINYMSLSTARATARAREVGVRKVLGAGRTSIAGQFFVESALYTTIGFALAFVVCAIFQPYFFNFLQINVDNSFLYSPGILIAFAGLYVATTLLAATYPSILLSAGKPVRALYGKLNPNSGAPNVRKVFTVLQFTISVALIICGLVMNRQINYLRHAETGIDRENVVMIPFSKTLAKHYTAFKQEIENLPGIQQTATSQVAMYKGNDMMGVMPKNGGDMVFLPTLSVDQNFMTVLGLKWKIAPQDALYHNKQKTVILNETAVERLNLGTAPVNEKIDDQYTVAGVVKDFNYYSLQSKIAALGLFITTDRDTTVGWTKRSGCLFVKVNARTNMPTLIAQMKNTYEKYDAAKPFQFSFLDEAYNELYKSEDRLSKILGAFTLFTVLIACLGLFGLSTFIVLQRTKEVGIRKVLGASVMQLTAMLSKDFVKLVIIAVVLASPLAWWVMNKWLQDFAYRTGISGWVFAIAGVVAIATAILTVSFQSIKAAMSNPVNSLRNE
jgi:putative ABC transport system permease protein